LDGTRTVVDTASQVHSTTRVDDESLEVRGPLSEQLASVDGRTSNDGRVVAKAVAKLGVVRGLTTRAEVEVSDTADVGLYGQ
jgi:hypothetical protein